MIITDERLLRTKCEDAQLKETGEIISLLERELKNSARLGRPGIGLAAPQCGINKNIAIIRIEDFNFDLVNCKIANKYDKIIFKDEGCLSFPNTVIDTIRYNEVHIINNLVYPHAFIATGLLSVAISHELDHLNGVLFMDNEVPKLVPAINKNKVGTNDPCPCGRIDDLTGKIKKYKKCCMRI